MREIQRFALENIYCAPHQDRQYKFNLIRVTKPTRPVKRVIPVYSGTVKRLPDKKNFYHVYLIGNLNPSVLNLLRQYKDWFRDSWVNVADDMEERNYILQMYNQDGVMLPRSNIFYTFIDERSIMFAVKVDDVITTHFNIDTFKFLRLYSNRYFETDEYVAKMYRMGIQLSSFQVNNNTHKVAVQNKIAEYKLRGGDVMVYVNGYFINEVTLHLPTPSLVEVVYDQSIISKESFPISSLRTFTSTKDEKLKFLLYRDKVADFLQYEDDNEIYVSSVGTPNTCGVYFYQHKDYVVRNVTDKDYSLFTQYVNNQATVVSNMVGGVSGDKSIILYTRKSGLARGLKYTSLKLHELYKLPKNVQLDVLSNTNYTITDFRAETLENSSYFELASTENMSLITNTLARAAVGYNGASYYYGNSPIRIKETDTSVRVPSIYVNESTVYEYDKNRLLVGRRSTQGPIYIPSSNKIRHLEFIRGNEVASYGSLYSKGETVPLRNFEYKALVANFLDHEKQSAWVDITNDSYKINVVNGIATLNIASYEKVKILYLDNPILLDIDIPLSRGTMFFPVQYPEDRGTGSRQQTLDYYPEIVEVYLNGHRLVYNLDFFIELPHINIVNKAYIDYTKENQKVHVRVRGVVETAEELNVNEINGFVNNGVLGRNNVYDIRDDRVFSVFVGGKIYSRDNVRFAEEDNTVRLSDPLNGLPYTITESMIPLYDMTGLNTNDFYKESSLLNVRISNLFNLIYPEPDASEFNIIGDHHYLYSPVVSKTINAILTGVIPSSVYTNAYDDSVIFDLLNTPEYKLLHKLDPIRGNLPDNLIEIHPHLGNARVNLNLHQYRFITNLVRVMTNNHPEKINLSGYLTVTT